MVSVLSELSTSYKEKNQLYSARALCNLACHHGSEGALVEGGGVSALMMIALVRLELLWVGSQITQHHGSRFFATTVVAPPSKHATAGIQCTRFFL